MTLQTRLILVIATVAVIIACSVPAQGAKKSKLPAPPPYVEAKFRADTPQRLRQPLQRSESRRRAEYDVRAKDLFLIARAIELLEKNQTKLSRNENNMYFPVNLTSANRKEHIATSRKIMAEKESALKEIADNPSFICTAASLSAFNVFVQLESGDIFSVSEAAVISVAGPDEMLVSVSVRHGVKPQDLWLSGFSTAGIVDNSVVHPKGSTIISGTKAYTTAGAASRTIFEAVPFNIAEYLEADKKVLNPPDIDEKKKDGAAAEKRDTQKPGLRSVQSPRNR